MKRLLLLSTILFMCIFLKAQSNFINQSAVLAKSTSKNCSDSISVCIDSIQYNNIGNYLFTLNGNAFNTTFDPCIIDTFKTFELSAIFNNGETGPFRLNSWTINGINHSITSFATLQQLVDSMRVWDPVPNWKLSNTTIIGIPKNNPTYSCQSIRGATIGQQDTYCPNEGYIFQGLKFKVPVGTHQFIVNDTLLKQKDTVTIRAACTTSDTIRQSIVIGVNRAHCLDFSQLVGTPQLATFQNFCAKTTTHVTFDSLYNFCTSYTARTVGTDTACIRVCDNFGVCDTTYLYITAQVNPSRQHYITDTITIGLNRKKCDLVAPSGTIASYKNLCPERSGNEIDFSIDATNFCVTYTGKAIGTDTACIEICNTTGTCDTSFLYIQGKNVTPRGSSYTFTDSIFIDSIKTKLDFKKPTGTIASIKNTCLSNSGTNVQFSIDQMAQSVSYRGISTGVDTACIEVCNTDGTCDTTVFYITAKATPTNRRIYSFSDTLTVGLSRSKCNFTAPIGANKMSTIGTATANGNVQFTLDTLLFCVTYKALKAGYDTISVQICNSTNICDTTRVIIQALAAKLPPKPSSDTIKLKVFERKTYCPDSTELSGALVNAIRFCKAFNGDNATATLSTQNKCTVITGQKIGMDTICLELCNTAGFCDTTNLFIQVLADTLKPKPSLDSISIKIGELVTYCPDTLELLSGTITSIGSCVTTTFDNSSMTLNNVTKCAQFRGLSEGKDTACIVVCNSAGLCDTTTLYVKVSKDTIKPVPSTERITVKLGETIDFTKIDTTQILGAVDTIYDACPGLNGSHALMILNRAQRTVNITGVDLGVDTMCIVVHNRTSNFRDTTTIIVTVVDTSKGFTIIANNDTDTVRQGKTITIKVYTNDTLRGKIPTSLVIIRPPLKGIADTISYRQGLISYKAPKTPTACGFDSFVYRVCVDTVCSQATVVIEVLCSDSLRAYNGISPNGDGRNDAFQIEGIQKYPNNTLLIYNRWGNEVVNIKNYQNDWQGTWNNKDLPDGVYFYLLRDEDKGEVILTGYLQILR